MVASIPKGLEPTRLTEKLLRIANLNHLALVQDNNLVVVDDSF
jgi:hypothetical protein